MPTSTSAVPPSKRRILDMSLTDRLLIERLEAAGATLEKSKVGPGYYGSYHEVHQSGSDERIGPRVQSKIVKRLELAGYLVYSDNHYELSEAGKVAARYARDLRAGRVK